MPDTLPEAPIAEKTKARPLRALFYGGIALVSFLACSVVFHYFFSRLDPVIEQRMSEFLGDKPGFDTVFIGSSRFYRGISPLVFDAELKAKGGESRSFNFGVPGMRATEELFLLREILRRRPPRLKWVVFELMDFRTRMSHGDEPTERAVYWHDFYHTSLVLRDLALSSDSPGEKIDDGWRNLGYFARNRLNLGAIAENAPQFYYSKNHRRSDGSDPREVRGFSTESDTIPEKNRAGYQTRLAKLRKDTPDSPTPLFAPELVKIVDEIHAAGAQVIFVIAPTLSGELNLVDLRPYGIDEPVLAFDRPADYPSLYDVDYRFDNEHLNLRGAEFFTRALAERCAGLMAPGMDSTVKIGSK